MQHIPENIQILKFFFVGEKKCLASIFWLVFHERLVHFVHDFVLLKQFLKVVNICYFVWRANRQQRRVSVLRLYSFNFFPFFLPEQLAFLALERDPELRFLALVILFLEALSVERLKSPVNFLALQLLSLVAFLHIHFEDGLCSLFLHLRVKDFPRPSALQLKADAGQILAFFGLLFVKRTGEDGNEVELEGELLGTDFLKGCFHELAVFGFGLFRDDLSFGLMGLGIRPADQVTSSGIQQRAGMFLELQSLSVLWPV